VQYLDSISGIKICHVRLQWEGNSCTCLVIAPATRRREKLEKVKRYSSSWQVISELRGVTCHMGSHSVTCHPHKWTCPT